MAGIERDHAARQKALEAEMRAANADLAQAYQEHHADSPQMQAAIDRFHRAMSALQKETMAHVLAMRSVLTPVQAAQFDETVVKSLNTEPM
jgi:Spy/CpxP family protein refolding chaperone